jgi:hypothetical protein
MDATTRITVSLLLLSACLLACGGGGGGSGGDDPGPATVDQIVGPTPARTGTVLANNTALVGFENMFAGDNAANVGARMFYSFPLELLPAPDEIVRVVFEDAQTGTQGTPFETLGDLLVLQTDIGPSLQGSDYAGPLFSVVLGTLSTSAAPGPRTLDLTAWTRSLLEAGADRLEFMIRFDEETDDDGAGDAAWLRSASSADGPGRLRITRLLSE